MHGASDPRSCAPAFARAVILHHGAHHPSSRMRSKRHGCAAGRAPLTAAWRPFLPSRPWFVRFAQLARAAAGMPSITRAICVAPRITVSGVRSSWLALSMKARSRSTNRSLRPSNRPATRLSPQARCWSVCDSSTRWPRRSGARSAIRRVAAVGQAHAEIATLSSSIARIEDNVSNRRHSAPRIRRYPAPVRVGSGASRRAPEPPIRCR